MKCEDALVLTVAHVHRDPPPTIEPAMARLFVEVVSRREARQQSF
jgi:hypothetical protein